MTIDQIDDLLSVPTVHDTGADRVTLMGWFAMRDVHADCGIKVFQFREWRNQEHEFWWQISQVRRTRHPKGRGGC